MSARRVSDAGAALVARFEGFRSHVYRDAVGVLTIGYGETRGVTSSTGPWSEPFARQRLRERLNRDYLPAVLAALGARADTAPQGVLDGFASFVYNVGPGGVGPGMTVGRRLRAGDFDGAADAILAWDKAGGRRLLGLTRRREAERAVILEALRERDPFEGYTASERRWIREYDALKRDRRNFDRRVVLRRVMTEQRKRVWRAAESTPNGWDHANRRARYRSLLARTS